MKRFLSVLLAVCMLLAAVPAIGVSAESAIAWPENIGDDVAVDGEIYEYVGRMGIDFYGIVLNDEDLGRPQAGRFGEGYFIWDGEKILVLNGTTGEFEDQFSIVTTDDLELDIVLKGENVWTVSNNTNFAPSWEFPHYESLYAFDIYNSSGRLVNLIGDGSLTLNAIGKAYIIGIWSDTPISIKGVKLDFNFTASASRGIDISSDLLIEDADISIDIAVAAAEGVTDECRAITAERLNIKNSRFTGSVVDLQEYAGDAPPMYGLYGSNHVVIFESVVSLEVVSQGVGRGIEGEIDVHIYDNSAVELSLQGDEAYGIIGTDVWIENSYAQLDCKTALVARDGEDENDGYIGNIEISDAVLLVPSEAEVGFGDEAESYKTLMADGAVVDYMMIVPRSYADVSGAQWFAPAVGFATAKGLFKGVDADNFAPFMQLTRAQMMTILARMSGANVDPAPGEIWYEKAVEWAVENGVSDGTDPNGKITREQMITMVWRFLGEPEGDGDLTQFTDRNKIDGWAEDALAWAVEYGVISGRGEGILDPDGTANRAEAAQLLKNFLINY